MATVIRRTKTSFFLALFILFSSGAWALTYDPFSQSRLLQQALSRYSEIEKRGGWSKIVLKKKQYVKGETSPVILQVKKRLQATGDFFSRDTSQVFTPELEAAVKKVQRQFGFRENGVIDALLVSALNVPVKTRIQQLYINLERARTLPASNQGRWIMVNIPEYKLHVYEGASHVFDMDVVVGSEKNKTATFQDELTHIVFSPYWNVPSSIVRNEILPAMRRNRSYLSRNGYEITGHEDGLPVIRQKPGPGNSLGLVKFLFPNEHAIYFHDTPAKSLFKNRIRAYSHGCIRLAEPAKLAEYLLSGHPDWSPSKIDKAMHSGKEQWVKLPASVPVYITYFTAWIDREGMLNFRDDIYEYDKDIPVAAVFESDVNSKAG